MRPFFRRALRARSAFATLLFAAAITACGGGDFAELFAHLLTARFIPADVTVTAGTHRVVQLEVTCDKASLDTPFGRLGIRLKLDPAHALADGVTATFTNAGTPDVEGFFLVPCNGDAGSPDLRLATINVDVAVAAGTVPLTTRLTAYIEVEPLLAGEPSKDSTSADLSIHTAAGESTATPAPG